MRVRVPQWERQRENGTEIERYSEEEKTLTQVYILGGIYQTGLGFSKSSWACFFTEADFCNLSASKNRSINRGGHCNYDRLC